MTENADPTLYQALRPVYEHIGLGVVYQSRQRFLYQPYRMPTASIYTEPVTVEPKPQRVLQQGNEGGEDQGGGPHYVNRES